MKEYERLTISEIRLDDDKRAKEFSICGVTIYDLYNRLVELEDKIERGELVENTVVTYLNMGRCNSKTLIDKALKFDELKAKLENGTLIELPCKVGDAVWCIYRYEDCFGRITDYFIEQDKAQCFIFDEGKFKIFPSNYNNRSEYYYKLKDIFLTKAEAEKRLKELQDG